MTKKLLPLMLLLTLSGCAMFGIGRHKVKGDVPPPLNDWTYVWIAGGSVIGIGIGIALAIILPGDDHIPYGVVGGCAAALVLCLIIGTLKVIVTWLLIGGTVLSVMWILYRLYKRVAIEQKIGRM